MKLSEKLIGDMFVSEVVFGGTYNSLRTLHDKSWQSTSHQWL